METCYSGRLRMIHVESGQEGSHRLSISVFTSDEEFGVVWQGNECSFDHFDSGVGFGERCA